MDPTPANARRLRAALRDFFHGSPPGYADSDVLDKESVIQLGVAPVRIDILSSISGLGGFAASWTQRKEGTLGATQAHYLSFDDLVRSKRAESRTQDKADLEMLGRVKRPR